MSHAWLTVYGFCGFLKFYYKYKAHIEKLINIVQLNDLLKNRKKLSNNYPE